jgi:hypothetical protein
MSATIVARADVQPERLADGAQARLMLDLGGFTRSLVECSPGVIYTGTAGPAGQLWYLISGEAELEAGSAQLAVQAGRASRSRPAPRSH